MHNKNIKTVLELVYKDLRDGKIYREATVQASLYHHLRNLLPSKFIYSEFTDGNNKYDLVISNKKVNNENDENKTKMNKIEAIIEIKYLTSTYNDCLKKVKIDIEKFEKLNEKNDYLNIEKYVVFI